ncbi:hypothetical protein WJX84_009175 [Apatococcus fuscideae]|uniref:Class II aldolase/adducin N-terminal domain-containing protein n=1 Tax=Apatococcus fuscideae TaxID=2026836 RepID=A0AAW1SSL6_9CHLO
MLLSGVHQHIPTIHSLGGPASLSVLPRSCRASRRALPTVAVAAPERSQISKSDEELGRELKAKFQTFESYPEPVYGTNNLGCSEEEWQHRVDLAAAYRLACRFGFNEGIVNHFTAWVPGAEVMLVHPFGLAWEEVTASISISVDAVSHPLAPLAFDFGFSPLIKLGKQPVSYLV